VVLVNCDALPGAPVDLLERAVRFTLDHADDRARLTLDGADDAARDALDHADDPARDAAALHDPARDAAPADAHRHASTPPPAPEISLTLLDDEAIAALNRRYLGREGPTDVLAFSLGEPTAPLGDVYVGFQQAGRQAAEHGVPLEEELARLAIHGTLHVLGHDHPEGPERTRSAMIRLQERLLGELMGRP